MADTDLHAEAHGIAGPVKLLYGLNDKPPLVDGIFVALQHVFAIFIPIVTPGLIIAGALKLDVQTTSYVLGMSLLVSGIATFIQARTVGPIGSGLLSIQGTSFAFVTAILAVVNGSLEKGRTPRKRCPWCWVSASLAPSSRSS